MQAKTERTLKILTRSLWFVALGFALFYRFYDTNFQTVFYTPKRHEYPKPERYVNVLLVVDSTTVDKYKTDWQARGDQLVASASSIFEYQSGIKFVVSQYLEWPAQYSLNITDLQRLACRSCDVKVGITDVQLFDESPEPLPVAGKTAYDEEFGMLFDTVLITTRSKGNQILTLAHELAHLFTAQHVNDANCGFLMTSSDRCPGARIDDKNWFTIEKNKYHDWQKDATLRGRAEWLVMQYDTWRKHFARR